MVYRQFNIQEQSRIPNNSPLLHRLLLPRDAMHKRGLCRHAVSVCVSVTFVDHVKTNKDIFEIFPPSGSHAIVVFPCQTA